MSKENKLGHEPAFAGKSNEKSKTAIQVDAYDWRNEGMSTRLLIAKDLLSSIIGVKGVADMKHNVGVALRFTDELLKQEQDGL